MKNFGSSSNHVAFPPELKLFQTDNPLTNVPKGFGSEMTLEVAEGRLEVSSDYMQETYAFAQFYAFCTKINAI